MDKNIGIKKSRMGINLAFILLFIAMSIVCAIMWGMYQANYTNAYWIENGIEVEAEYVGWYSVVNPNDMHRVDYYAKYKYVDADGKEYFAVQPYLSQNDAEAQLGKKITIVIDPNGNDVRHVNLKNLTLNYKRDYILAIIFCFPVPIALYFLIYRGIYRSVMNYKINKKVGDNELDYIGGKQFNPNAIKQGEVTKVRKWLVCYIKVKYQDENGIERERWAQSWFTHKEAKFLQQKKTINIVPYKNAYGILEKM